jgi:hypothetical protein
MIIEIVSIPILNQSTKREEVKKMKKVIFVLLALCLVSSLAFAAESTVVATTDTAVTTAADTDATAEVKSEVAAPVAVTTPAAVTTETTVTTTVAAPVTAAVVAPEAMVLKGNIIDNTCAGANKDNLADFIKTHTKQCAIMPGCIESGYSIFADGKLYTFDKDSSAKVAEFLKKADSKLEVSITAKQVGDELSLVSIENQN